MRELHSHELREINGGNPIAGLVMGLVGLSIVSNPMFGAMVLGPIVGEVAKLAGYGLAYGALGLFEVGKVVVPIAAKGAYKGTAFLLNQAYEHSHNG